MVTCPALSLLVRADPTSSAFPDFFGSYFEGSTCQELLAAPPAGASWLIVWLGIGQDSICLAQRVTERKILSLDGESHPPGAAGQRQSLEHVLPGWRAGSSLQAGCVPQAQHTQPTLIPQAWRAQTHPPWPRPDYSGINHTDYMLQKRRYFLCSELAQTPCLQAAA